MTLLVKVNPKNLLYLLITGLRYLVLARLHMMFLFIPRKFALGGLQTIPYEIALALS